ncbi:iron export ABC transporter permease subunit FetB [Mycobacterium sp. E2462]|uniref:ABC transporter permease n=1 Tax=Mycobacterium sp. E2462 TaxID=1834133 RepID=UPI001E300758|nr:iron export ABC transporter permease subunit FetB [Mycobacterium sp. E2462]
MGFQHDSALAASIEEMVATVTGVRAVRAYPRTASVVIWYAPRECDTEAVLSAIARAQNVPGGSHASRAGSARVQNGVVNKILGGLTHTLLNPQRGATEAPPEIQRLRAALDRLGYDVALPGGPRRLDNEVKRCELRPRRRWTWVALPLGLVAVKVTGVGLHSMKLWAAGVSLQPGGSRRLRFRRPASALVVLATSAPAVPTWGGVVVSLLLVTVAGTIAYRRRLGLTREIVVAATRAAVQLVAAGALLRVLFQQTRLLGAAGWVTGMVVIAGQVAGRRAPQLPQARVAATSGVATSTVFTLGTLLAGRVIAAETRVIVPVGGMIVSSAMLAAGSALGRLDQEVRHSQPAIEARLSLGQSGRQAILPYQRSALRTALIPAIDSTKVVGLISLPGAMTGLILAGINPLTAIRYQIVVMYMQLAATAVAALVATRIAEESLFDDAQRLIQRDPPDER